MMRKKGGTSWQWMAGMMVCFGCGDPAAHARPQWKVHIVTDAPLPALGDQVRVEMRDGVSGALLGVRRQLDASQVDDWPLSFGVVPTTGDAPPRLRVRLFRQDQTNVDGEPPPDTTIEMLARLPAAPSEGILDVQLTLAMRCFGAPASLEDQRTCDPRTGASVPESVLPRLSLEEALPRPGSWPYAGDVPCGSSVPAHMTCVPGGVFLLGGPRASPFDHDSEIRQRVVRLSAFALDTDEVAVRTVRQLVLARRIPPPLRRKHCTYLGEHEPRNDGLPINCVSWATAHAACRLLHKRLPSEAEWEYAAGNRGLKSRYPWGSASDICFRAVVGRAGPFVIGHSSSYACIGIDPSLPSTPVAGGHPKDVNSLGVRNLAGNVREWTADRYAPYDAPCWRGGVPLHDPICERGTSHTVRGGSWATLPGDATTWTRRPEMPGGSLRTGFRCARSL